MTNDFSWIERFYTHFLGRDLIHLFSGGMFICIVEYAFWGEIFLPKGLSLEVIGFLMVSYVVGLAIYRTTDNLDISGTLQLPVGYSNYLLFFQDMMENYNQHVLNHYERYIFLMNIEASVGLSSILGGVLMIVIRLIFKVETITVEYILLVFSLLIFGIYMIFDSKQFVQLVNKTRNEFANGIKSKQQRLPAPELKK